MKKIDLTRRFARQSHLTKAAAADQLDRVVHGILKSLRKGKPVSLPGLGTLTPGGKRRFGFKAESSGRSGHGGK